MSPNETLDMEPYKYEVPPLPLESAPPKEPPVADIPPEEVAEGDAGATEEPAPGKDLIVFTCWLYNICVRFYLDEATEEAPEEGAEAATEEKPAEEEPNDEVFEPPAE